MCCKKIVVQQLARLIMAVHSGTLSHYCLPRELLAAGFHPWPGSSLLSQPECRGLLPGTHIDGKLSADVPSTWLVHYTVIPSLRPSHNQTSQKRDYRSCQPSSRETCFDMFTTFYVSPAISALFALPYQILRETA